MTRLPRSAVGHVLNEGLEALGDARLLAQTAPAGPAATGGAALGGATQTQGAGSADAEGPGAVGLAEGDSDSMRAYDDAVARRGGPDPQGTRSRSCRRDPTDGAAGGTEHRAAATGPATPEDAWKWEGVPPGRSLIGKVEAGQLRYYMGDDGHGPRIVSLPPAWPPGEGGDAG